MLAAIPEWIVDLKGIGETIVAIVAALTALWKFALKPFLTKLEQERNEDFDRRLEARIHPVEDKVSALKTETNAKLDVLTGRLDRFSDALTGTRVQLGKIEGAVEQQTRAQVALIEQQRLLHAAVREHMESEEKNQ